MIKKLLIVTMAIIILFACTRVKVEDKWIPFFEDKGKPWFYYTRKMQSGCDIIRVWIRNDGTLILMELGVGYSSKRLEVVSPEGWVRLKVDPEIIVPDSLEAELYKKVFK